MSDARLIKFEKGEFWVIKYAFTRGIYRIKGMRSTTNPDYVVEEGKDWRDAFHGEDEEWCMSFKRAQEIVRDRRKKAMKKLLNEHRKLRKLKFDRESIFVEENSRHV